MKKRELKRWVKVVISIFLITSIILNLVGAVYYYFYATNIIDFMVNLLCYVNSMALMILLSKLLSFSIYE